MHLLTAISITLLLQTDTAALDSNRPSGESCAVIVSTDTGLETVPMASLQVLELSRLPEPFALPADAPAGVEAIRCERDSLVPASNDYKLLVAGYPLYIRVPDERLAVLGADRGRAEYRALVGEFGDAEIPLISASLEELQAQLNAASTLAPAATLPAPPVTVEEALAQVAAMEDELDFRTQVEILSPFADSGNAELQYSLAYASMHLAIDGKRPEEIRSSDMQRVMRLAQSAADGGDVRAYNLLYMIYGNGWGVGLDKDQALAYLRKGADAGDNGAKLNLAISLFEGSALVAPDRDAACRLFVELGEDSSVQSYAAYYLGLAIYRGECGYEADRKGGMELIEIAANHEVRDAMRDFARNLEFGWVQPADLKAALELFRKAAELGDGHSLWRMGMAYVKGEFGEVDSARAVDFFRRSVDVEHPQGMSSLAVMYATGDGVEQDYAQARLLYQQAAALGEAHALRALAWMHANGEGVAADFAQSRLLYLQYIALGGEAVSALEEQYQEHLSRKQFEQIDSQLEQWQAQRNSNSPGTD